MKGICPNGVEARALPPGSAFRQKAFSAVGIAMPEISKHSRVKLTPSYAAALMRDRRGWQIDWIGRRGVVAGRSRGDMVRIRWDGNESVSDPISVKALELE